MISVVRGSMRQNVYNAPESNCLSLVVRWIEEERTPIIPEPVLVELNPNNIPPPFIHRRYVVHTRKEMSILFSKHELMIASTGGDVRQYMTDVAVMTYKEKREAERAADAVANSPHSPGHEPRERLTP